MGEVGAEFQLPSPQPEKVARSDNNQKSTENVQRKKPETKNPQGIKQKTAEFFKKHSMVAYGGAIVVGAGSVLAFHEGLVVPGLALVGAEAVALNAVRKVREITFKEAIAADRISEPDDNLMLKQARQKISQEKETDTHE